MATNRKSLFRPSTARLIAAAFLFVGLVVGVFDAPQYAIRGLDALGLNFLSTKLQVMDSVFPYRFGRDIRGGPDLTYRADTSAITAGERSNAMAALRDVIERRVNLFGVSEPRVEVERSGDEWRLSVELAGVTDVGAAIQVIGETPYLEFREERPEEDRNAILEAQKIGERAREDPYFIQTALTGRYIQKADVGFNPTTYEPEVLLELTGEGADIFSDLTKRNVGKRLAIYLDGAPISAPVVNEEITGGKAQISGNFTPTEAKELVGRLNAGALPVPVTLIAQETRDASLGQESLVESVYAGVLGLAAVGLFMLFWYRLPGIVAVVALLIYVVIVLAIFKLIPVTLTIPGIAGFILSIGMAVDANVLIFERLKEELRAGKPLEEAIREGFGRAWTSIRDSNASSLITAGILYWLGTRRVVQGFALTLGIGIGVSMFSAILVTRTLLLTVATRRFQKFRFAFLSGFAK